MLSEARRNATVRCLTPVTLITLGSDDFKALMGDRDSTMASGMQDVSEHRAIELVKTLIAMTANIQGQIERQVLRRGEVVFREGEPGDCMFSIIRGDVAITASMPEQRLPPSAISEAVRVARHKSVHNKSVMVATMKEGDVFGERALMAGERRNATVRCDADECELAVLRKKDFVQLMKHAPEVAETGMNAIRRKHEVPPSKPLGDAAASVA
jgi:CRP-like cAMP-binding protein